MSYEYARGAVPTVGYVETERPNDFLTVSQKYLCKMDSIHYLYGRPRQFVR